MSHARSRRPAFGRIGTSFLALLLLVATASMASAQVSVSAKLGVFDKQRIVDESGLGKAVKTRFEKQQAGVLSDEKRLDRQRELARMRDELQSAVGNADRDLERAYKQALLELVQKLDPIITDFAKTEGYDFLFDQQQYAYAKDGFDVTDKIIAKVNATFPQ